jgi:hypothetical protein
MDSRGEFKEVTLEIIGWENNKIWRTIKDLTIRPGNAIAEYCEGQKEKYLSPVTYYFAAVAITYYLLMTTGFHAEALRYSREQTQKNVETVQGFGPVTKDRISDHNKVYEFFFGETGQKLVILPLALLLRWLLFRRYNNSFKSNAWYSLFTLGHESIVLGIIMLVLWYLTNNFTLTYVVGLIAGFFYDSWASCHFYKLKLVTSALLNLLLMTINIIATSVIMAVAGGITLLR